MRQCEVHSTTLVATAAEQLYTFVEFTLLLKVLGTLDHDLLRAHKRHRHDLLIEVVILRESDRVCKSTTLTVVENCICDVTFLFKVSCNVEASLGVGAAECDLSRCEDIPYSTEHADARAVVLSFTVHLESFLDEALSFQVLCPPLVELRVSLRVHEVLQALWHVQHG
jgi:hypothetical protein